MKMCYLRTMDTPMRCPSSDLLLVTLRRDGMMGSEAKDR